MCRLVHDKLSRGGLNSTLVQDKLSQGGFVDLFRTITYVIVIVRVLDCTGRVLDFFMITYVIVTGRVDWLRISMSQNVGFLGWRSPSDL